MKKKLFEYEIIHTIVRGCVYNLLSQKWKNIDVANRVFPLRFPAPTTSTALALSQVVLDLAQSAGWLIFPLALGGETSKGPNFVGNRTHQQNSSQVHKHATYIRIYLHTYTSSVPLQANNCFPLLFF